MLDNNSPLPQEQFINHLSHGNFTKAEAMLDDSGKFEIQDEELQSVSVSKNAFLDWWQKKWDESGWVIFLNLKWNLKQILVPIVKRGVKFICLTTATSLTDPGNLAVTECFMRYS